MLLTARSGRAAELLHLGMTIQPGESLEVAIGRPMNQNGGSAGDTVKDVAFTGGVAPGGVDRVMILADVELNVERRVQPLTRLQPNRAAGVKHRVAGPPDGNAHAVDELDADGGLRDVLQRVRQQVQRDRLTGGKAG